MYLRPHLSRALSLFRPDLFHSLCTPLCAPPPAFRTGPSFLSFPLAMLTLVALTIPRSLFQPFSPTLALSCSLPRRASAHRSRFFPPISFFFLNTPPSCRVIFIICYLLRHTPPAVATAVAALCPARPTRKNRKIEENKSGRRGAPRIPRGGALER